MTSNQERIPEKRVEELLQYAFFQGFYQEHATFPIFKHLDDIHPPEIESCGNICHEEIKGRELFSLDNRKEKGLECFFEEGLFLKDINKDLLPDATDLRLFAKGGWNSDLLLAATNLLYRFGMETTGHSGFFLHSEENANLIFENGEKTSLSLEDDKVLCTVGSDWDTFIGTLCTHFPQYGPGKNWRDVLLDVIDALRLATDDGLLAAFDANPTADKSYGGPKGMTDNRWVNRKDGQCVYEKEWDLPWDKERFLQAAKEAIEDNRGKELHLFGAVSEPKAVREMMQQTIEIQLADNDCTGSVTVISAYKQGYSWLDEVVIPSVAEKQVNHITIFFKPFLVPGETQWKDEDGATPSYGIQGKDPSTWLDLPIRYLQELYPIADRLCDAFSIALDDVEFKVYEGEEDITYHAVFKCDEKVVHEDCYRARWSERAYLDAYPHLGLVHPNTGFLEIRTEGQIEEVRILTDIESIWNVYQQEVLPACATWIQKHGEVTTDAQPLFQKLLLEVEASEPNERLVSREDLMSSLDALHEDMYFVGSDFFKHLPTSDGGVIDAPGLILPDLIAKDGPPKLRVSLFDTHRKKNALVKEGVVIAEEKPRESVQAKIISVSSEEGILAVTLHITGVDEALLRAYAQRWASGQTDFEPPYRDWRIHFTGDCKPFTITVKCHAVNQQKNIESIDLLEGQVIGYDAYQSVLEELREVSGIEVFPIATSYEGRTIHAIRLLPKKEGYVSRVKAITKRPSVYINARHHANEVSSTNAALQLLRTLLVDSKYNTITEHMNLVIVPMENVDGTEIHFALQKKNPYWKFHVARFNAIGKEFYHEHFKTETIHSEAMGLTRLYERYAPDILVDNHGVPSHEWEQPMSGYTSPAFKGFWLPRSILYGYFWYVKDQEYKANVQLNKQLEEVIATRVSEYSELNAWNVAWRKQFEKYAHAWLPKLFPADYYKDMIHYWIGFDADPTHRYPSIRYPWITSVAYTSEVADETAQGEYLALCAKAHVTHDLATLDALMDAEVHHHSAFDASSFTLQWERKRPISLTFGG